MFTVNLWLFRAAERWDNKHLFEAGTLKQIKMQIKKCGQIHDQPNEIQTF